MRRSLPCQVGPAAGLVEAVAELLGPMLRGRYAGFEKPRFLRPTGFSGGTTLAEALSQLISAPERAAEIEAASQSPTEQVEVALPPPSRPPRPPSPEPAPSPPPAPVPPKAHWFRLFTGRAILRTEDGTVVKSVLPGERDYPHHSEFVNWN